MTQPPLRDGDPVTGQVNDLERIPVTAPASVAVFRRILTHGPTGRTDVARATGISQAAVTRAVNALLEAGFVQESDSEKSDTAVGRPTIPLMVVRDRSYIAGIKVTAERTYGVLTDLTGEPLAREDVANPSTEVDAVLGSVEEIVKLLRSKSPGGRLDGVGVAISGDVDRLAGVVRQSPLLGWEDVAIRSLLEARLGVPVTVENDVRALTASERVFGAGVDVESFAIVTIGAGIGCGIFVNGNIVDGAFGVSGEIGHLPLGPEHLVCSCGRRGCVETVASSGAILDRIRAERRQPELTMDDAFRLAHAGESHAVAAFSAAGEMIGLALATLANLIGPDLIVISGEGVAEFDLYADRVRSVFARHAFGSASNCAISLRSHTFDDWASGAAVTVIEDIAAGIQA
jgi:predicted NBD/HSP70 family sugar kinase